MKWQPAHIPFTATPGPTGEAASIQSDQPAAFLSLYLTDDLLSGIVQETNRYAAEVISSLPDRPHSRVNVWQDVTLPELKTFLGLLFLTGLIWKPQLEEYWIEDEVLVTPYFSKVMSRNRFQIILRFIHFSHAANTGTDRLYKVRSVLDYIVGRFQELYHPEQNISIDEGSLLWRGRLSFRVFNPMKPIRYSILSYILSESKSGYCYSLRPYCGQYSSLADTVTALLGALKDKGHHLYMDNYYNSVVLCTKLLELNTHICGTLRPCRGPPAEVKNATLASLGDGGKVALHNGKVLTMAWSDRRLIRMVTSIHHDEMKDVKVWRKRLGQITVPKPRCVDDYNHLMKGVDRLDQNISYYPFTRKSSKWTTKFVFYLMQVSLFNAFIVYKKRNPGGSVKNMKAFILSVVKAWTTPTRDTRTPRGDPLSRFAAARPGRHCALVKIPPTAKKALPTRVCRFCTTIKGGPRSETRYRCSVCLVPLHKKCFPQYHAEVDTDNQTSARL